ncbi:MAG: GAF domain-containing protein [Chloroflexi bacterium]|nr:GAF domain-containing protein [Chloroflexota bacterium]
MQSNSLISRLIEKAANRRPNPSQLWILLGLSSLYVITYPFLKIPLLISFPAALAGWFYHRRGGFAAGILALPINLVLYDMFTDQVSWSFLVTLENGFLIGHFLTWLICIGVGYLSTEVENQARINQRLYARERFLTLINQVTRAVIESRDPDAAHESMISHLLQSFTADHAHLVRWDGDLQQMDLILYSHSDDFLQVDHMVAREEEQPARELLQVMRVTQLNDLQMSHQNPYPPQLSEISQGTRSALVIPLTTGEYKFGTLVLGFKSARSFSSDEIELVELASSQFAMGLRTIQQEYRLGRQLREANSLAAIEQALSESERVDLETVLQLIVDSARELIPKTTHVVLHLLDEDHKQLIPRAVAGFTSSTRSSLRMRIGEGVAGQVLATGDTIAIPDIRSDPRFLDQTGPVSFRSLIVAPVGSSQKRVGTISLHSYDMGVFHPADIRLLSALGTQAAIAIENADLLETTRQDYKEMNVLYHISRTLSTSLNSETILRDAVEFLQNTFHFYYIQVYVIEPGSGVLRARYGAGHALSQSNGQEHTLPLGTGIPGHVAETGESFFTNNVDRVIFHHADPRLPETRSEMALPIKSENRVLGVLDVHQTSSEPITLRQMKVMSTITHQLALALQQAEMYSDLQDSLKVEKQMRDKLIQAEKLAVAGQLLASVSHELNNPLQAIENALFLLRDEKNLSRQALQDLETILSETDRMTTILSRLRTTYRPPQAEDFEEVQLNTIIESTYALTATLLRHKGVQFHFAADPHLPAVSCIPDQIRQVMLNLFMNAVEAMPGGGNLSLQTCLDPGSDRILISVRDSGIGISPEIQSHMFEPFFTSKETGSGLGLSITRDIVQQHQGDILAENHLGGGAIIKIWLPIRRAA